MRKYYKAYFKSLAVADVQLAHTDDKPAFYFVKDIYNPDAFDDAIKSIAKTTCLIIENYRLKLSDGRNRNNFKHLYGRFNILTRAEAGYDDSIDDAYALCESIAEDMLAKMREQLQEGAPIIISDTDQSKKVFFPFQDIELDPIGPVSADYYGVSVSFYWQTQAQGKSITQNWT